MPSPRSPLIIGAVAVGGAVGALGRYGLSRGIRWDGAGFPWATFVTNVIGCLVIGALVAWLVERGSAPDWVRPLLVTGVLGGFTTFSTFALEVRDLLALGNGSVALAYVLATLVAGIAAVAVMRQVVVAVRRGGSA